MKEVLPFIVAGIATGSIYGLAATGLVLSYKTSGIFNFGYGAMATAAAYLFYYLHYRHGLDWKLAFFLSVLVAGPLMGLAMERIGRRLSLQRTADKIVGTVGIVVLVQGLATVAYGSDTIRVRQYLPKGAKTFRLLGVNVLYSQLYVTIIGVIAVVLLYGVFRWMRTGVAMRAVVDDPDLVAMQGTSPATVRRVSWVISSIFAALSGVLVLPFIGLNAITLTFLVVQAFGAAAFGAFASVPLTFAGGVVLGVAATISQKYVLNVTWLSGLPDSLPFIVLLVVLLALPRQKLVPPSAIAQRPKLQWRAPPIVQAVVGVLAVALLALLPEIVGAAKLGYYTIGLTSMILLLSLGLLVRTSGQVSLCQSAFGAVGAVAFSQLAVDHHVPWLLALVLASLIVVPVGALVAIPAIRLSGLFLALATFGFGIMVQNLFYARGFMFTVLSSGRAMPRPAIAHSDKAYYYLVLIFVVLTALGMAGIHRSRLGRVLRGVSESPVAVVTMGLTTNTTRLIVFCISAFLAGTAGILYGSAIHFAVSGDTHFQAFYSLILLALLALAPFAEPWYAIFALIGAVIPAYLTGVNTPNWLSIMFGFFAISVSVQGGHTSMPTRAQRFLARFARRPRSAPDQMVTAVGAGTPVAALSRRAAAASGGLEVEDLTVRFGGLVAVDNLSFKAPPGRITGLIGPNGAGKTTTFDACGGLNRRVSGRVRLHGTDVTNLSPARRARLGLGRTFQRMQLGDSLTAAENVSLGRESSQAGRHVLSQLLAPKPQLAESRAATAAALELCGIADLAGLQAGALSTGQRRLVELARCLAGPFDVLLLDEPSSGLDRDETAAFDEVLRRVVAERGCGILLVEHDMSLVMGVCDYMYVLDFGKLIFEGDPPAVASSPVVQAAYLGSEAVMRIATQEATL